jgi:tagatose 1,6-diphosphate aldolase
MEKLSIGKLRGLEQLADPRGIFVMCAMDHRGSLKRMLNGEHPETVSYQTMVDYKLDLCRTLAPHASAVLLDPVYGASQAIASGALPGTTGLLVSMEATGYAGSECGRITELLHGWSVEKVKNMGGQAAKLLLYYRPDLPDIATKQLNTVRRLAEDCSRIELPFLVEPKSYKVEERERDPREFARIKPQLVIETTRQVAALPIDVLKAEFPADLKYEKDEGRLSGLCHQLDLASQVPWVILSAGVNFELFRREVEIACKAGASGFLAGRALWQEATHIQSRKERLKFLETTVAERLNLLAEVANTHGIPWRVKLGSKKGDFASAGEEWYQTYLE